MTRESIWRVGAISFDAWHGKCSNDRTVPNTWLSFTRRICAPLLTLAALVVATEARAQNISITTSGNGVTRTMPTHTTPTTFQYVISQADCLSADEFVFQYAANVTNVQIEVWLSEGASGPQCNLQASRGSASGATQCVKLPAGMLSMPAGQIKLKSSDIANSMSNVSKCVDSQEISTPRPFTLYFLLLRTAGDVPTGDFTTWNGTQGSATTTGSGTTTATQTNAAVDLLGPPAPTSVVANSADSSLNVTFMASGATDTMGFNVYCDPPASGAPATAASSTGAGTSSSSATTAASSSSSTGGASSTSATTSTSTSASSSATGAGGGSSANSCPSSVLVPGQVPPAGYKCGTVTSTTATSLNAIGLMNGSQHVVGVAAFDNVGNVGPLSMLACGTPQKVDDFFTNYRDAGGQAGDCACSATGANATYGGLLASALALAAAAKRRGARGRRR